MFTRHAWADATIRPLRQEDLLGRLSIPGIRAMVTDRRLRKISRAKNNFHHRAKNGINDAYTFFHVVEVLLAIEPGEHFTAANLAAWLTHERDIFIWDAVTIGRILNDLIDSFAEATPGDRFQPLVSRRLAKGTLYEITDYPEARAAMLHLLDDLIEAGEEIRKAENAGRNPRRIESPLLACPSLMNPLVEMTRNLQRNLQE